MCERGETLANETVLLVLTGNGLKDVDAVQSALKEPLRVRPEIELEELKSRLSHE